jgi:hypothetical protein
VHSDTGFTNADSTVAPAGTYGAVTDGRIGVTNASGSYDFGADQYFHVATVDTAPRQLIAPPSFLSDKLEGRLRVAAAQPQGQAQQESQQQATAGAVSGVVVAPTSATGGTGDSRVSSTTSITTVPSTFDTNVFQATTQTTTSTSGLSNIIQPSFTGTVFYRLEGPFNIPITHSSSCSGCTTSVVAGDITLGVNYALQRANVGVALRGNDGGILNVSVPSSLSGIPITISGNQVTFNSTLNLADFPRNTGAFSCSDCSPTNGPGLLNQISFSGVITGSQAKVTIAVQDATEQATITATLPLTTPPNNSAGAISTPVASGGTDSRSQAYFNVQLDSAGRLLQIGPSVGEVKASVGGATNTIVGSAPSAGNLVWGTWTNGTTAATKATITDNDYVTFQPANNSIQPWITGEASNSLPPSLGTLTFTPIGSVFNSTSGRLNSASLTADFVNRNLSLSINATNITAGNTFQMNATTGFNPTNSRFSGGFNSVTCSGPCVGTPGGSFGGFFAGAQAQGAGVAFNAGFGVGGTGVAGAVALKR